VYLTISQIAERLNCSHEKATELCRQGILPHLPVSLDPSKRKYYRVDERAVAAYKRQLRESMPVGAAASNAAPVPAAPVESTIPPGFVSLERAAEIVGVRPNTIHTRFPKSKPENRIILHGRLFVRESALVPRKIAVSKDRIVKPIPLSVDDTAVMQFTAPATTPQMFLTTRILKIEKQLEELTQKFNTLVASLGGIE
jgi:hypothetical protein